MTISQGEAVFQAVREVMSGGDAELYERSAEGFSSSMLENITEQELDEVHEKVFLAFANGVTVHSKNPDEAALLKYIPGLVNNWLRKDKRLNGGVKYEAKNPGSRSGSADESVQAMRALLSVTTDPEAKIEIQKAIEARVAELKPKVVIKVENLPESLRHLVK